MDKRIQLQTVLENLVSPSKVYFQPPETIKMVYPCIVYSRSNMSTKFADDRLYDHAIQYQVTIIDKNPDSEMLDKLTTLPMCKFERHFTKDNLNHDVYKLYY